MNRATTKIRTINRTTTAVQLDRELSKVGISAMAIVSTLIGVWAMACMIGALINNGPLAFIGSWSSAVFGG